MKLKIRLSITFAVIIIVVVALISTIILMRSRALQTNAAIENAHNIAGLNAKDAQRRYESYMDTALGLTQIMDSYRSVNIGERRSRYTANIREVLESNPRYVGIFTLWKPNTIDGMDTQYANTTGTDGTGQFVPLYTRESGAIELKAYPDYQKYLSNLPNTQTISEPELRKIQGKDVQIVTVTSPIILDDGSIVGLVGVEIDISALQEFVDGITPYETGGAAVVTNSGFFAAHYVTEKTGKYIYDTDKEMLGDNFEQVMAAIREGKETSASVISPLYTGQVRIVYVPFTVGETTTPWCMMVTVPMNKVLAPVQSMTYFTIILAVISIVVVTVIVFLFAASITKPIVRVVDILKDISDGEGDLTKTIPVTSKDEIGDMAHHFNLTLEKIKTLVSTIKNNTVSLSDIGTELASNMTETAAAVNQIATNIQSIEGQIINQSASVTETNSTMEQITKSIDMLNELIESQAASVTQSSSSIEEMLANIKSVAQTLAKNANNVEELISASDEGRTSLQGVSTEILDIARESEGLLAINALMENIASQTNLLSMNAAIEAAHAGEAGKGFAVVADEIRKLAESSGEQSKTTSMVLKKIKTSIDKITVSTDEVLKKFEAIDSGIKVVSNQEDHIRSAMEEQNAGSQQILEAIEQLNSITQNVRNESTQMLSGSKEIILESRNLGMVTQEISNGMSEMATGAEQINISVNKVNGISGDNKDHINILAGEVAKFKID